MASTGSSAVAVVVARPESTQATQAPDMGTIADPEDDGADAEAFAS